MNNDNENQSRNEVLNDIANMGSRLPVEIPVESFIEEVAVEATKQTRNVPDASGRAKKAWATRRANAEKKALENPIVVEEAVVESSTKKTRNVPNGSERAKKAWATRRANKLKAQGEVSVSVDAPKVPEREKGTLSTLEECSAREVVKVPTRIEGLDNALGGGFVRNSAVLFAGKRGNGKSTLMTVVAGSIAEDKNERVLYVSGEEDKAQFAHRANRMNLPMTLKNLYILDVADIDLIDKYADEIKPTMIIVDSIQSLKGRNMDGKWTANGRTSNYFTERLRVLRKKHHAILVLVGHETKTGDIAGDNALQHEVDAVLKLDPDPVTNAKVLAIDKNRFAPDGTTFRFMILDRGIEQVSSVATMEYKGPELIE